jgi:hypothetical protein
MKHAGAAVDEVRRAEFFRKGGAARTVVKGKRWLLLSRWVNLNTQKRRQLNALFALNRRVMKAYLLKESLDRLWSYTYEGSMLRYLKSWIDQLRWQRLKPMEKLADMLLNHLEGILNYADQSAAGRGGGGQRQHQSASAPGTRLSQPQLPATESTTAGRHAHRIRRFPESRVICTLLHFLAQSQTSKGDEGKFDPLHCRDHAKPQEIRTCGERSCCICRHSL